MNPKEFNAKYGPEWRLTVDQDKGCLDNIVPLYMMVIKMGEWATAMFNPPPWPYIDYEEDDRVKRAKEWEAWTNGLVVPYEVIDIVERRRRILVVECKEFRYFDAKTDDLLDHAALSVLTWLWEQGEFPEPEEPSDPGFALKDIVGLPPVLALPDTLKSEAKRIIEKYIEKKQRYTRDWRLYMDAKKTIEEKRAGAAWAFIKGFPWAKIEFLE